MTNASTPAVVVVGAGVAGVRLVRRLRELNYADGIVLLDAQASVPYDRPPLSKQVLRGEQELPVLISAEELEELAIDYRPGQAVVRLDTDRRVVVTAAGDEIQYTTLVLATGAQARRLPGVDGHLLRTFEDAVALREHGAAGRTVLIVGAGLIGCEVAASLSSLGAEVHVVDPLPAPMVRVLGPVLAKSVAELHEDRGVRLHLGAVVASGGVGTAVLSDGTELRPDAVVEAIGVAPDTSWLDDSGLELGDGVVCDANQRTNLADVYVIGDLAVRSGRRTEHWTAASEHADRAAAAIVGVEGPAEEVPYWWSDQFGLRLQGIGEVSGADRIAVGGAGRGRLAVLGRAGRVIAAVGFGAPGPLMRMRAAVEEGAALETAAEALSDPQWHDVEVTDQATA